VRPLGDQIRRLREERGLTQEVLAERASMNYKYLGRVELAQVSAGAVKLVNIARALGVTVSELFETTPR
jgi:transcriptional regulator with XRE-family HTH domain